VVFPIVIFRAVPQFAVVILLAPVKVVPLIVLPGLKADAVEAFPCNVALIVAGKSKFTEAEPLNETAVPEFEESLSFIVKFTAVFNLVASIVAGIFKIIFALPLNETLSPLYVPELSLIVIVLAVYSVVAVVALPSKEPCVVTIYASFQCLYVEDVPLAPKVYVLCALGIIFVSKFASLLIALF